MRSCGLLVAMMLTSCTGAPIAPQAARDAAGHPPGAILDPPSERREASELPVVEGADGFVLLRADATVRNAPADWAQHSELSEYGAVTHALGLEAARPARIVGRAGRYVAIETGASPTSSEHHCYHRPRGIFAGFVLTVFVHEDDLHPVLVRPLSLKPMQGIELELDPGVALGPPGRGSGASFRLAAAAPLMLSLQVAPDAVGLVYQPRSRERDALAPDRRIDGPCDGGDCMLFMEGAAARITDPSVDVRFIVEDGERSIVEIGGPCVQARAYVASAALRPIPPGPFTGQGFGTSCGGFTSEDFHVPPATAVRWRDGRLAGHVGSERVWLHRYESEMVRGRRCFARHPTSRDSCGSAGKFLSLCFDPNDITTIGEAP